MLKSKIPAAMVPGEAAPPRCLMRLAI